MNQPLLTLFHWTEYAPNVPHEDERWAETARGWLYEDGNAYASAQYTTYKRPEPNVLVDAYRISIDHKGDRREVRFGHAWTNTVAEAKAWAEQQLINNPRISANSKGTTE